MIANGLLYDVLPGASPNPAVVNGILTDDVDYQAVGTNVFVKNSGTWVEVQTIYVKDGGTWKTVSASSVKNNGTWVHV